MMANAKMMPTVHRKKRDTLTKLNTASNLVMTSKAKPMWMMAKIKGKKNTMTICVLIVLFISDILIDRKSVV